jgi:hypothetical protein
MSHQCLAPDVFNSTAQILRHFITLFLEMQPGTGTYVWPALSTVPQINKRSFAFEAIQLGQLTRTAGCI